MSCFFGSSPRPFGVYYGFFYPFRQDVLERRMLERIRKSSALGKARVLHAAITDSDPIDKVRGASRAP